MSAYYTCCIYSSELQTRFYHESKHYEPWPDCSQGDSPLKWILVWSDSCSSYFTHLTLLNYQGNAHTLTEYHFLNKTISLGNSNIADMAINTDSDQTAPRDNILACFGLSFILYSYSEQNDIPRQ